MTDDPLPRPRIADWLKPWRYQPQFWLLMALVAVAFLAGLERLPLRGEESRRARIAIEMIERGDLVVPRQQGEPFLSRPPLQNWLIALTGLLRGQVDCWAIRGPSAVAMIATAILIYAFSRTFLSATGALVAGLAFATSGQVLELGRSGETEALLTLCISGSLMLWYLGSSRGWPPLVTWGLAALGVAAGVLTKGPQAPVYFLAAVGGYLLLRGRLRELLSPACLLAAALAVAVVAAWQIPFWRAVGSEAVWRIYASDVGLRFSDTRWSTILAHLATYPLEIFACLLPWSILLLALLNPRWRRQLGTWPEPVVFLATALVVTFPTCWLVPGARGRYFMPLYPCFAPVVGLVADLAWQQAAEAAAVRPWRRYVRGLSLAAAGAASLVLVISVGQPLAAPAQSVAFASLYLLAGWAVAGLLWWAAPRVVPHRVELSAMAIASLLLLSHLGVMANALLRRAEDTRSAVELIEAELPETLRLVSFGPVHHLFAYYYERPIPLVAWPEAVQQVPEDVEYFCFETMPGVPVRRLPFAWQTVAVVSCERNRQHDPKMTVVIGRRLPVQHTAQGERLPAARR